MFSIALKICWHQVIFPRGYPLSIVTLKLFNPQVRDGLGWFQFNEDTNKKGAAKIFGHLLNNDPEKRPFA